MIWTAGVAPSPAGKWLQVETDRAGRVRVQSDLTVPGHPEIFVIGDTASFEENGKPLPGVAQVAMQQGRHAGKGHSQPRHRRIAAGSLSYFDKGNMAVVGKGFAVLESHKVQVSGFGAWLAWAIRTPTVPGDLEPPLDGLPAMGLDLFHRPKRFPAHRESPWSHNREGCGRCLQQVGSCINKNGEDHMAKNKQIQNIAIVGTGVIGASWAALYLARGFNVTATDPAPNAEENLRRYIDAAWKDLHRDRAFAERIARPSAVHPRYEEGAL